jgi:hypothetical protein
MLKQLQDWWQNATPETQAALWDGSMALVTFLGGLVLGSIVARILRGHNFDPAFRPWGASPFHVEPGRGFTPTTALGLLVRLTVWGAGAWWLLRRYGRPDIADSLVPIAVRTWTVTGLFVATLLLASLLARRVIECLHGPRETAPDHRLAATPHREVAGAVGAGVYCLVLLVALLTAADYFDWPLTRTAAAGLWQLAQNLLIAGAAVLIGSIGARWARDLPTPSAAASPQHRAAHSTALSIMAGTTILAAGVLLFSAGVRFGLVAIALLGIAAWLGRSHLADLLAGLRLKSNKVATVWLDGAAWQVSDLGWLQSEVGRAGEFCRVPNRQLLDAAPNAPAAAVRH